MAIMREPKVGVQVYFSVNLLQAVDAYADRKVISRTEAIRQFVEAGLAKKEAKAK
jgi:metal-responsive CopG/Arc/MetJ family transcriptional regulator